MDVQRGRMERSLICAISDLHGTLIDIEPCDLVLICGDIVPLNIQSNSKKTYKWFQTIFKEWADNLPCNKVLFVAGNHDLGLEHHQERYEKLFPKDNKVTYLCNTSYDYKGIKIFGTPYCKQFGHWAFNRDDSTLTKLFEEIPYNLDILMSHDAPYDCTDICLQQLDWISKDHLGNMPLRNAIIEKKPKVVFHGHLHSANHKFELLENSKVVNCSIVDEQYNVNYSPIYYDLSKEDQF